MAPLRRKESGSFTPKNHWHHYAGNSLAPLRRKRNGSIAAKTDIWLIVIWLALSFSWGVRKNTWSGFGVTIQSTNMAMLFVAQAIAVAAFALSPLHFLWMIPAAFVVGYMSRGFPFSLITPLGRLYGQLCCMGLDSDVVTQNKARLDYARELISSGRPQDEATRMALDKFPGKS